MFLIFQLPLQFVQKALMIRCYPCFKKDKDPLQLITRSYTSGDKIEFWSADHLF